MTEKTLDSVQSEDETKQTDDQEEVPSQEDEESVEDIDDDSEDGDEDNESGEESKGKKPFKNRKERAKFFKKRDTGGKDEDVLKRSEFYKANENKAIRTTTTPADDDPDDVRALKEEINEHWVEIVKHFNPKTDRSDPEEIAEAIYDAHAAWSRRNKPASKKEDTDSKARAALMRDQGTRGSQSKGTEKVKKTILRNSSKGMDDWYPGEE